ncbi:MAG: galactokinase [Terriglobales bacterium]|jgi:galactokinase
MDIEGLKQEFRKLYGSHPQVFRAPGRVNLIGEHTDYNEGFVMPAAIDFSTWAAVTSRSDSTFNLRSHSFSEPVSFNLSDGQQPRHNWSDYAVGVIQQIKHSGQRLGGADILIDGEVPIGAGLSSSAAIEVVVGLALLTSSGRSVDRTQLALLCQRAENDFVGMRCGIMDQFVSCHGKSNHALMLDCRTLAFELLPLPPTTRMVICNSMVKHQLAAGEYNQRRAACEEGVRILRRDRPTIQSLRDVSANDLETSRDLLSDVIYRRCRHVVTENARVQRAAIMLREGNLKGFGELMAQSHTSLRDDYEVSCRELDILVEIAGRQPGVHGARMTGGGFGGCTINLVSAEHAANFRQNVATAYEQATGLVPEIYISTAADGASQVE